MRPTLATTTTTATSPDSPVSPIDTDLSTTTTSNSEPSSPIPTATKNALPSALAAGFGIVDLHLKKVANGEITIPSTNATARTTTSNTSTTTTTTIAQAKGSSGVQWYMFIWKGIVYIGNRIFIFIQS